MPKLAKPRSNSIVAINYLYYYRNLSIPLFRKQTDSNTMSKKIIKFSSEELLKQINWNLLACPVPNQVPIYLELIYDENGICIDSHLYTDKDKP